MFEVAGKTQQGAMETQILCSVSYSWLGNQYWSHIFREKRCISSLKVTTRVDDSQHLSLSICSCKSTALQPHAISPMTSVSMVVSLSVWVCLNKLFWWPAAIQNQLPATGWLASPSPNSCLGPFNSMVKHTYCKVEQTKFLLQVMGFVASLAACDGRP